MKCPHCLVVFHDNWDQNAVIRGQSLTGWFYRTAHCPACSRLIIEAGTKTQNTIGVSSWRPIFPAGASRGPVPPEVPEAIATDYVQACNVLPISPMASAALSRLCLQAILRDNGYRDRDLAKEIDLLLNESDTQKAVSSGLRMAVDAIRNFGNFSAHPITDVTTLQIIEVEPEEAEWCLETIEEAFQHFYVRPAEAARKKAALNAKLIAAGKPPAK